jgi:hypothetical protein
MQPMNIIRKNHRHHGMQTHNGSTRALIPGPSTTAEPAAMQIPQRSDSGTGPFRQSR